MAPPEPGDAGNPFQSLLGDLMNMLGSTGGPDQWEMTRAFAVNVATGATDEGNVDPLQRITVEQLARAAELNVVETTGMPVSPDGRRLAVVPVSRAEWTLRALDSWRRTITTMTPPPAPPGGVPGVGGAGDADLLADAELAGAEGLGALLGQWMTTLGPMLFGLQVGSVVGHLARRALGQYPLALPWTLSDELLLVPANVAAFAADWSLPEEEALLWVSAREMAANTVLTRPAVRARMEELVADMARTAAAAQQDVAGKLGGLAGLASGGDAGSGADLESMQRMLGDPEALLGELLTPEARRVSEQLTAAAVVIDAYADRVAERVGEAMVGSHRQLAEAWYRRRIERGKGEEAAGALFGLDLDQHQVDRGRAFVAGVVERAGDEGLARLWLRGRNLPTPSEVDAPGLWLERIDLPESDDEGTGSGS